MPLPGLGRNPRQKFREHLLVEAIGTSCHYANYFLHIMNNIASIDICSQVRDFLQLHVYTL